MNWKQAENRQQPGHTRWQLEQQRSELSLCVSEQQHSRQQEQQCWLPRGVSLKLKVSDGVRIYSEPACFPTFLSGGRLNRRDTYPVSSENRTLGIVETKRRKEGNKKNK